MRAKEIVNEAATSIVYHYVNTSAALKILASGEFLLSSTTGNKSEEQYAPPGYPYFLSTTRSRVGDYHRYAGDGAVMFTINGDWLNQRYKTKPIDYWERAWQHSPDRTRESEDRVFSKTPSIPIDGVTAIHVLLKGWHEFRSPQTRKILILAKKRGIATYLYDDEQAWRLQNISRSVSPGQMKDALSGQDPSRVTRQGYTSLEPWLELIFKNKKADLSPKAEKARYKLVVYGGRYPNEDDGLGTDMSNARKPSAADYPMAVKINDYMRRNRLSNTVALKNALVQKWSNIK